MPEIISCLSEQKIMTPTSIQNIAIPQVLKGKSGIISA